MLPEAQDWRLANSPSVILGYIRSLSDLVGIKSTASPPDDSTHINMTRITTSPTRFGDRPERSIEKDDGTARTSSCISGQWMKSIFMLYHLGI
jgi:hypothetical protein